jgi:26S proteasome regulatory subunit N12
LGLNLLYLLVENRLSDFHCEVSCTSISIISFHHFYQLELLSEAMRSQPAITFCTQLDKHLVVGSYDQVLVAAANPPVKFYSFFLTSLLETVRINIGECVSSAYDSLTLTAATKILMFENKEV